MVELPQPSRFWWGDRTLAAEAVHVGVYDNVLEITCVSTHEVMDDVWLNSPVRNRPLRGELENGWRFDAEYGFSSDGHHRVEDFTEAAFAVGGHYWNVRCSGEAPRVWVARITGSIKSIWSGNLAVKRGSHRASSGHLFLVGRYNYHLIKVPNGGDEATWYLIIDTGGRHPPQREALYPDFAILQFVVGSMLRLGVLHGISDDGSVSSWMGGSYGRVPPEWAQSHPPIPMQCQECWAAVLFRKLSRAYWEKPSVRFYIPVAFYIDALVDYHVQGRYLRLHVALEAFARWFVKTLPDSAPEFLDEQAWGEWLSSQEPAIKAIARPTMGHILYRNVANASRPPTGQLVKRAFDELGIALTPSMKEEIKDRNLIVHTAEMFRDKSADRDVDDYVDKIALIRSALVGLVSLVAGYRGEIVGWERKAGRGPAAAPSSWWSVDPDDRAAAASRYSVVDV